MQKNVLTIVIHRAIKKKTKLFQDTYALFHIISALYEATINAWLRKRKMLPQWDLLSERQWVKAPYLRILDAKRI